MDLKNISFRIVTIKNFHWYSEHFLTEKYVLKIVRNMFSKITYFTGIDFTFLEIFFYKLVDVFKFPGNLKIHLIYIYHKK